MQLNNHFGHNFIIATGLEYFAISIDPQNSAKIRQPQKISVVQKQSFTTVIAIIIRSTIL